MDQSIATKPSRQAHLERVSNLARVFALWQDARRRGWIVTANSTAGSWRAHDRSRCCGMVYDPFDEISTGVVSAYDQTRTMTLTGVPNAATAVSQLREFLGWPEVSAGTCGSAINGPVSGGHFAAGSADGGRR